MQKGKTIDEAMKLAIQYVCLDSENYSRIAAPARRGNFIYAADGNAAIRIACDEPGADFGPKDFPLGSVEALFARETFVAQGHVVDSQVFETTRIACEGELALYKKDLFKGYKRARCEYKEAVCPCCGETIVVNERDENNLITIEARDDELLKLLKESDSDIYFLYRVRIGFPDNWWCLIDFKYILRVYDIAKTGTWRITEYSGNYHRGTLRIDSDDGSVSVIIASLAQASSEIESWEKYATEFPAPGSPEILLKIA